jgi:L-seryl-tRNA(Ser) seleniumtransferase
MLTTQTNRRRFFGSAGLLALMGAVPGGRRLAAAMAAKTAQDSMGVYTRLGLRPLINAAGTYTHLGGSLMPPEVTQAMEDAAKHYVPIRELTKATGERIAQLSGNEGALVTTGAAGAIFVATCACIARDDPDKAKRLPFTDGMKNEVVMQKLHHTGWVRQIEGAGGRPVDVEYLDEMERAITGNTAMIYHLIAEKHFGEHRDKLDAPGGNVSLEQAIELAKRTRVPLLIDAAAELPPTDAMSRYTKMGADLVAFSGGKGLRGPQNAGLLLGRKDLVDMAATFQSPYSGIGRHLKISKETMIGMVAAVERYVQNDHKADWKLWTGQIEHVKSVVDRIAGVESGYVPDWVTNHVPRLWVRWDEQAFNFSREECFEALQKADPPVVALRTPMGITVVPWMMVPGEERVVAQRLKDVLEQARRTASRRPTRTAAELIALKQDNPIDAWDPRADGLI